MMNRFLSAWLSDSWVSGSLLFAETRAGGSGRRLRGVSHYVHTQTEWWQILLVSVILIALVYAAYKWHKAIIRMIRHNPCWLFWELCRKHRLDWSSCWLMCRLALFYRLRNPIRLFLQPASFTPENLGPDWEFDLPQIEKLREQLFGVKPEA